MRCTHLGSIFNAQSYFGTFIGAVSSILRLASERRIVMFLLRSNSEDRFRCEQSTLRVMLYKIFNFHDWCPPSDYVTQSVNPCYLFGKI